MPEFRGEKWWISPGIESVKKYNTGPNTNQIHDISMMLLMVQKSGEKTTWHV